MKLSVVLVLVLLVAACEGGVRRARVRVSSSSSSSSSSSFLLCGAFFVCSSSSVQTNSAGWGWENSRSCIVANTPAQTQHCPAGPTAGSSSSSSSSSDCGGYPFCSSSSSQTDSAGWGWENGRSCIVFNTIAQNDKCPGSSGPGNTGSGSGSGSSPPFSGVCPSRLVCPASLNCGCYSIPGLGRRKQEVLAAGGASFLASAMLETDRLDTNYPYGDNKVGDSFNAGIAKQNWFLSKQCWAPWRGMQPSQYRTMDEMNRDLSLDAAVYAACINKFGLRRFMAAHRNGETGFNQPNTFDIDRFIRGFEWTKQQLENGHLDDDLRFWVSLPAI